MKSRLGMVFSSPPVGDAAVGSHTFTKLSQMTTPSRRSVMLTAWACLFVTATAQTLPYIPTTIFLPAPKPGQTGRYTTGEVAYIFSPQDDSVDLLALNITATLDASSLSLTTLSSNLPFLGNESTAFIPSLADNGSLIVYAGDCSTSSGSGIWSFDPSVPDAGSTSWTQEDIQDAVDGQWMQMGPGFLGSGFSFSTTLEPKTSPANTFVYGGMCPDNHSYPTNPQSQATYSNQMVKISPSTDDSRSYTVEPLESSGPPVPEAGFTFTGLSPSFSNRSSTVTQQINYVLLGGHTQYAFINMSTVAIWSLPEETWSFVSDIGMTWPGSAGEITSVDSRSGHTAVLNEDGTALAVLGGWVGDLTQAATPQLAVLQIGSDYGGEGKWQWYIPDSQPSGDAMYGHGAILLPGNVMMVYGGHAISSSGNNEKRQTTGSGNTASFLNLTSMAWSTTYTNPSYTGTSPDTDAPGTDSPETNGSSKKQTLGLGLGLGLGIGLFLVLLGILAYIIYRRRRRTSREAAIRALAQDNPQFLGNNSEFGASYDGDGNWYMGGADPYSRGGRSLGYQSLQTGRASMDNSRQNWFGDMIPEPPAMVQMHRKPMPPRAARGQHQPAPQGGYEQVPNPRGLGSMNPIFEDDEDDAGDLGVEAISPLRDGRRDSGAYSDPFLTPTTERALSFPAPSRPSQTSSPEESNRVPATTDPEVQDWMTDIEAADALLSGRIAAPPRTATVATAGGGRTSPSRRGFMNTTTAFTEEDNSRTDSNISESNRSNLSRSNSLLRHLRPGFGDAVAAALAATTEGRGGSSSSSSAPSYNTARSSFPALQAEGPGLLLGRDREREKRDRLDEEDEPGSPSKHKPRRSWLGSLRRVFTGPSPDPSPQDEESPFRGGVVEANDFEARLGSLGGVGGIAADGLLRRKAGRGAWESTHEAGGSGQDTTARHAPVHGEKAEDEEWDIEKAVEKRLVQVMFTVPKERLRVVNAEPDFSSERSVVLVEPKGEEGGEWVSEEQKLGLVRPMSERSESRLPTPSPLPDDEPGSEAEKEALRRELDLEWERIEASEAFAPRTPSPKPRALEPRRSALLQQPQQPQRISISSPPELPSPTQNLASLTLEEQINKLGLEIHQVRSAAHTPLSLVSHHSDADVMSAEAIRYEKPSGSTSTLQIVTPGLSTPSGLRFGNKNQEIDGSKNKDKSSETKTIPALDQVEKIAAEDFRSESNLRGREIRASLVSGRTNDVTTARLAADGGVNRSNNNSPSRRVLAMVQQFESKSSREGSPSSSPVRGSASGSPVRSPAGISTRGRWRGDEKDGNGDDDGGVRLTRP